VGLVLQGFFGEASVSPFVTHDLGTFAIDICTCFFYVSGLGFLLWCIARRAAWMTMAAASARPMTFIVFVFILLGPGAVILSQYTTQGDSFDISRSALRYIWLLYPFTANRAAAGDWTSCLSALITSGVGSYLLGTLIYPFWKDVVPGAGARRVVPKAQPAPKESA
jgi:hypothetical protein